MVAGCSDNTTYEKVLPVSGDEISFDPQAGKFTSKDTRTVYGFNSGDSYASFSALNISWVEGDGVRVYSPEGDNNRVYGDYSVQKGTATETNTSGYYLQKVDEPVIHWGDINKDHNFYAFYPSGQIISGLQTGTEVTANIPVTQEKGDLSTQTIDGVTWKIISPDMSYAMMAGIGKWTAGSDSRDVSLTFTPLVTVVDVVINGPSAAANVGHKIYTVSLRSSGNPIVGDFTYDVATGTFGGMSETLSEDNNIATVDCMYDVDGTATPIELGTGEKLNVKFFLLPRDIDAKDLSVSVVMEGGHVLTQSLADETSTASLVQGEIARVITPNLNPAESSNWMSMIADNVYFASQLSIPGSKHSYTYTQYPSSSIDVATDMMQCYQAIDLGAQFDQGIRAFDMKLVLSSDSESSTANVFVSGGSIGVSIADVLTTLKNKIDAVVDADGNPTECAVITINWVSNGPSEETWLSAIINNINSWSSSAGKTADGTPYIKTITSSTTMGDMRGHIAVMVNYPLSTTSVSTENVGVVLNYSSSVQNTELQRMDFSNQSGKIIVQNLYQVNNPSIETDPGTYAWRDSYGLLPYYITEKVATNDNLDDSNYDLLATKVKLMSSLFEESTANNALTDDSKINNMYVNDLGGFCVVGNPESTGYTSGTEYTCSSSSWWGYTWSSASSTWYDYLDRPETFVSSYNELPRPSASLSGQVYGIQSSDRKELGQGGNTAYFAEIINPKATDLIHDLVNEGRTPLGIVYMNFAGVDEATVGGKTYNVTGIQLPSLVITNNFKFALVTKSE